MPLANYSTLLVKRDHDDIIKQKKKSLTIISNQNIEGCQGW